LRAFAGQIGDTFIFCPPGSWSAIGKWHGVPLSTILDEAGLSTRAQYIVFH
jgi:hypothetical protein